MNSVFIVTIESRVEIDILFLDFVLIAPQMLKILSVEALLRGNKLILDLKIFWLTCK